MAAICILLILMLTSPANAAGPEMVAVKGGCFEMGSINGKPDEKPAHTVCVDDFLIGRYEVTVEAFRSFVNATNYMTQAETTGGCYGLLAGVWVRDVGASWRNPGYIQTDKDPVVCVSYNDALEFAKWQGGINGMTYQLPTEAQWEYAASSAGKPQRYSGFSNDAEIYRYGNFCDVNCEHKWKTPTQNDGYAFTAPVGGYLPNDIGIYDMTGNVWEWVQDWYGGDYYAQSPRDNPQGPLKGGTRVKRGGCWRYPPAYVRNATRMDANPNKAYDGLGFRLSARPASAAKDETGDAPAR